MLYIVLFFGLVALKACGAQFIFEAYKLVKSFGMALSMLCFHTFTLWYMFLKTEVIS